MKKFWYLSGIFKKPGMSNHDFGMPVQDRGWRLYLRKFRQSIGRTPHRPSLSLFPLVSPSFPKLRRPGPAIWGGCICLCKRVGLS